MVSVDFNVMQHHFENKTFYHGSTNKTGIEHILMPPNETNILSEIGRTKNLDKIFFTEDIGLAKIYAGRASNSIGGEPTLFRVVSPSNPTCLRSDNGASIWMADWSFCEKIQ